MTLKGRIDLVRPIDCARLSFHGGSCWRAFRPGLDTGRIARPVRSRRVQISTATGTSPAAITRASEQFIVHSRFKLKVGWEAFEIYPPIPDNYWKPEYARSLAELDLLAVLAQRNSMSAELNRLDGRAATRDYYAGLLSQFDELLSGAEEPVHQFLKAHPELLCPTSEQSWSKLPFGDRVSDFVFKEPFNDYQLVEIEAPIRELFRKDGQQREELTHAINQVLDWIQYIGNNKQKVEADLGLVGISPNPRALIVIGRSQSLTDDNRRKLATIQAQHNKLRILTYDDLIASARANLEKMLGPLSLVAHNAEIYYFRN